MPGFRRPRDGYDEPEASRYSRVCCAKPEMPEGVGRKGTTHADCSDNKVPGELSRVSTLVLDGPSRHLQQPTRRAYPAAAVTTTIVGHPARFAIT